MDALEAIRKRRSVRSYTDTAIDDADLDEILRLALLAPTGGMSQAWSLIVVRLRQAGTRDL
jgi:nitroreductase